ncbi:MAG: hemerythrin domain-containing protein [Candidatus Heimdallarchaeota archaeon]
MKLINQLIEEHKAISQRLLILDQICQDLEQGKPVEQQQINQTLDFIRIFADERHHCKEEELLFPAMVLVGIPHSNMLIKDMLEEHDRAREYYMNMSRLQDHVFDNERIANAFIKTAREYIWYLNQHMHQENNVLYPLAVVAFTGAQEKQLVERFDVIEDEIFGSIHAERFQEIQTESD